ncbi:MAG: hypothetical protein M3Q08_03490 [Pseudomonadota bacterium]|jgi:hypothetical protein|nr:hypothetical protein [Pseudomonadota bacterium]
MKTLIAAIALTIAIPAGVNAQSAQQQDKHDQHQSMDHGKEHKGCCEGKGGMAMKCCDKAAKEGKKMGCCSKGDQKGHEQHSGHQMKH